MSRRIYGVPADGDQAEALQINIQEMSIGCQLTVTETVIDKDMRTFIKVFTGIRGGPMPDVMTVLADRVSHAGFKLFCHIKDTRNYQTNIGTAPADKSASAKSRALKELIAANVVRKATISKLTKVTSDPAYTLISKSSYMISPYYIGVPKPNEETAFKVWDELGK